MFGDETPHPAMNTRGLRMNDSIGHAIGVGVLFVVLSTEGQAVTLEIDASNSFVRTSMGSESDGIDTPLSGQIDASLTPAQPDHISGPLPSLIQLTNISVPTTLGDRNWAFPSFPGIIDSNGLFSGSSNPCAMFFGGGFCLSQGNFASYAGTFDGVNLSIDGGFGGLTKPEPGRFFYQFHISAKAVPELPSRVMLSLALAGLIGRLARPRGRVA